MRIRNAMQASSFGWCIDLELIKAGPLACRSFKALLKLDGKFLDLRQDISSTRAPVNAKSFAKGLVQLVSPSWYSRRRPGQRQGQAHRTTVCGEYARGVNGRKVTNKRLRKAILGIGARCTVC